MEYTVQRGDTIAKISKTMGSDWNSLKQLNPTAVGRSKASGNWFFREGAVITNENNSSFAEVLKTTQQEQPGKTKAVTSAPEQETLQTAKTGQTTHTLQAGETVWGLATRTYHVDPQTILAANNISDPTRLQIGQTLIIPESAAKEEEGSVVASWYGQYHHGRPMANGEPFNMYAPTIAHKTIPLGTKVRLENPETGERATATVTDRGPYVNGREVDLSYGLAQRLSLVDQGVGNLILEVL